MICCSQISLVLLSALIIFTASSTEALDVESAKRQACFNISNTVPLDLNWVATINKLYYPLINRLELYSAVEDLLGSDPSTVSEGSIYYDSCLTWNVDISGEGSLVLYGFDGLKRAYSANVLAPYLQVFEFWPTHGTGLSGTAYTTLTDNKTFLFVPMCTTNGEMTWGVGSTIPNLPKETVKLILEHAKSLGFREDQFTELRYDTCKKDA